MNQLIIGGDEILPDNFQGRPDGIRNDENSLLHFANAAPHLEFELAISVGMAVGIRLLLFEKLKSGANVVTVFFKDEADGQVIAGLAGFGGSLELGQTKFVERLDFAVCMGIAIKMILQFLYSVRGEQRCTNKKEKDGGNHGNGEACVPCPTSFFRLFFQEHGYADSPATPGQGSCFDRAPKTFGTHREQVEPHPAYRNKARE